MAWFLEIVNVSLFNRVPEKLEPLTISISCRGLTSRCQRIQDQYWSLFEISKNFDLKWHTMVRVLFTAGGCRCHPTNNTMSVYCSLQVGAGGYRCHPTNNTMSVYCSLQVGTGVTLQITLCPCIVHYRWVQVGTGVTLQITLCPCVVHYRWVQVSPYK